MLEQKDLEMIAEIVEKIVEKTVEKTVERTVEKIVEKTVERIVEPVRRDVKEIKLTIENDIDRKINIIAEGHLDLSRKLDDALRIENEKEMLMLRVISLESEVRKLKERIEQTA